MAELLSRLPHLKGLSNKSKDDLLAMAGIGSVWMTGSSSSSNALIKAEKTFNKRTQPAKKKQSEKKPAANKRRTVDPHSNKRRPPAKASKRKRATPDAVQSRPAAKKIKQEEEFDPHFDDDGRNYELQGQQYVKQESGWYNDESDDNDDDAGSYELQRRQFVKQESGWYNDDSEDEMWADNKARPALIASHRAACFESCGFKTIFTSHILPWINDKSNIKTRAAGGAITRKNQSGISVNHIAFIMNDISHALLF